MLRPAFSLCVYCGSRPGDDPAQLAAAETLGRWIGRHGGRLVYGGGNTGLMGAVANACLDAGGMVLGIIPQALVEREWAHQGCTELCVVETMHERKRLMAEHADAFLALAGGIGTFEEFFEAWTWKQLGYHDKPIGLLNVAGYYDPLLAFLKASVAQGYMSEAQMALIHDGDQPAELARRLIEAAGFTTARDLDQI